MFLGDVILPDDCLVGDVCSGKTVLEIKPVLISNKENEYDNESKNEEVSFQKPFQKTGVNSIDSVYSEIIHRITNLSSLLPRAMSPTPSSSSSVSLILSTSSELPDLTPLKNVLTYSLTVNDIELTFKVILKIIKTPKTTIQLLIPIIKDLFNDREFRDNVSLELPGFLEVLYELLSLNNEKITEFVLGLLSGFKDVKSNKSMREGSRMEGGIVVGVDFYERLINVSH